MIEFRQLRYFTLLAETLHYGRAAELLHITQPPLSRQISALEQELGVQLFNRTSRTVQLTQAGEQFYRQAKALLDDLDGARRNAQATARGDQGELRLSFTMSAAWNLLPRLIKAYTTERPSVQLHLSETLPRDLQSALSSGSTDIGIAFPSHLPRHLRYQALHHEPLCAVLPADHPLAAQARIDVAQLADEPFISFPASTAPALHEALFRCCRENGFTPLIRLETHLQQTIVNLVSAGLGVALVPDSMRRMQLEGAVLRPLLDSPRIEQGLYWNGDNDNPCLPGFLDCARRLLGVQGRTE
ncbi:MAG TPA: LysR family transcriptional regulator [Pseudomonas sp.]|nr:LysR family transcriptional regulator [Pseudomonas sp.]